MSDDRLASLSDLAEYLRIDTLGLSGGAAAKDAVDATVATLAPANHGHAELPTPGQKNAMVGTTVQLPGSTNPYVTNGDPRLSDARPSIAHTHPEYLEDVLLGAANGVAALDGTGRVPPAQLPALGGEAHLKLTADLPARTAIALADIPGLAFPVVANQLYRFQGLVVYRSAATTTGLRLGATVPAFAVFSAAVSIPQAVDGTAGMWHGWITATGDSVVAPGVQTANTDYVATIFGVLLPSADGTFQLQHATEIAGSGVTVRRGSTLSYTAV